MLRGNCYAPDSLWHRVGVKHGHAVVIERDDAFLVCSARSADGIEEGVAFTETVCIPKNLVFVSNSGLAQIGSSRLQRSNLDKITLWTSNTPPVQASSISIVLDEPFQGNPNTRKRLQTWFLGLTVCEGAAISGIGESVLAGIVRRTVPVGIVFCGHDTRVNFEDPKQSLVSSPQRILPPLLKQVLQILTSTTISDDLRRILIPKGLLLYGPSGVGKTFHVSQFVNELLRIGFGIQRVQPPTNELADTEKGELALRQAFASARSPPAGTQLSVVILDDIDRYAYSRKQPDASGINLTASLLTLMDGIESKNNPHQVLVLATTTSVNRLDPALRRPGRFDKEIALALPTESERIEALRSMLSDTFPNVGEDDLVKAIAQGTGGCSYDQITRIIRKAPSIESLKFKFKLNDESKDPSNAFVMIAGQDSAKRALRNAIEWPLLKRQHLKRMGLSNMYRGILLYGPPGCAKTSLVRNVANAFSGRVVLFSYSCADIYSSGYGDAEAFVRQAFAKARELAPSLLFFDEIDSLVGAREGSNSAGSVTNRVLSTFLNEMDGVDNMSSDGVLVVAATNAPDNVDKALLRPGRFDKLIYVDPPNPADILTLELGRMGVLESVSVPGLVEEAMWMSGADVAGACRVAALKALSRGESAPTHQDLADALRCTHRSCPPHVLERYEAFARGRRDAY